MKLQVLLQDPDFIKKAKLNYRECQSKGLHEGERLSLVCVDAKCTAKGLICPVCKETNHKDHNVMHIKYFLSQLHSSLFENSPDALEVAEESKKIKQSALSDNLLKLERAKKEIRNSLQQMVNSLAQMVKQVEEKIQETYKRVRQVILSQGSLENKLPSIYSMLLSTEEETGGRRYTDLEIHEEISKCANLMESKNNKLNMVDKANNIVEEYQKQTETCGTHLMALVSEISDRLKELPIALKSLIGLGKESSASDLIKYQFSQTQKANHIKVSQDGKEIACSQESVGGIGYAFINEEKVMEQGKNDNKGVRKISLQVKGSMSDSISLGMGNADLLKVFNYTSQQIEMEGLYGICAMGINITDIDSPSFVFSQGDVIELVLEEETGKLIISRRNGMEREEIYLGLGEQETKKLKFFVSLPIMGDSVRIVE